MVVMKEYKPTVKNLEKFEDVIFQIAEKGKSLREACKTVPMSIDVFRKIVNSDEERQGQYVRAREERHDYLMEEMIVIADSPKTKDSITAVQRDKLRIEARQWALSKMNPKKFGNKIELEGEIKERIIIEMDLGEDKK